MRARRARTRPGRPGEQRWPGELRWHREPRDRGDDTYFLPAAWAALERVGYRNGIHCTLSFNHRWFFQRFAFALWRKLVFDRRALIRACLADRGVPLRLVDYIACMVFPVRGTPLPLQR